MPLSIEANITPELLVWARLSIGYNKDEIARLLDVEEIELSRWENGLSKPTVAKLRKLAEKYKRPLAVFFLPSPPPLHLLPKDFRRLPPDDAHSRSHPQLLLAVRRARRMRSEAIDLLGLLGESHPSFGLRATTTDDAERLGSRIRAQLGINLDMQSRWRNESIALNSWKNAVEKTGVLVFQASRVPLPAMRGFSLSERILPTITLNSGDFPRPRIFTLMHEFCHLLLQNSGICNEMSAYGRTRDSLQSIETFCNRFAGAVLVPETDLLNLDLVKSSSSRHKWSYAEIDEIAKVFKVSREVILRRLVQMRKSTNEHYKRMRNRFLRDYADLRKKKPKGGPSPPVRAIANNGHYFTNLVLEAFHQDKLSARDVSSLLDVKLKHLSEIETRIGR